MHSCKGCLALGQGGYCLNGLDVLDVYIPATINCPCKTCIVKMVCKSECTDFREFANEYGPKRFKGKYTCRFRRVDGRMQRL